MLLGACAAPSSATSSAELQPATNLASAELATLQDPTRPPQLLLPRHPALSPNGKQLAFAHQGDLWVADVLTGDARRITAHDALDARPKWSPDGKWLAFSSNRHGNYDIFIVAAVGGAPQRITWHSDSERLIGWIDQERLLIGAQRDRRYSRRDNGLWVAYRDGRTPTVLVDTAIKNASLSADESHLVYERGHGDPARRAYRGAANSSLWTYDFASNKHAELTTFDGNDLAPMFDANADWVYFLSDRACVGNEQGRDLGLWKVRYGGGKASLVYHPGGSTLRNAAIGNGGKTVVAELGAGFVSIDLATGQATDLPVYGSVDLSTPKVHTRTVSSGASQLAVSPDGESIAFVAAGDVYVLRKHEDIERCVRVTSDPAPDYSPIWTEDGNALLFISERDGNGEIYRVRTAGTPAPEADEGKEASDKNGDGAKQGQDADSEKDSGEEPQEEVEITPFWLAREFDFARLTHTDLDEDGLGLSPDGETLAWFVGPNLVVGDPATCQVARTITTGFEAPEYDWSPDSAWLVYAQSDNDFNYDIFLARVDIADLDPTEPGVTPVNITRHPDDDTTPRWSPDGRKIGFTSRRMMLDETDAWVVFLRSADMERNKRERLEAIEAEKKAKKKAEASKKKAAKKTPELPEASAADAILCGTWEGKASGPAPLPEDGMPFVVHVLLRGEKVVGDLESLMFSGPLENASWNAETKTLAFTLLIPDAGSASGEIVVSGDQFTGAVIVGEEVFPLQGMRTSSMSGLEESSAAQFQDQKEQAETAEDNKKVEEVIIDWDDIGHRIVRITRREGNEAMVGWNADSEKLYFNANTGTRLTNGTTAESGFFSVDIYDRKDEKVESSNVSSFTLHDKTPFYVKAGKIVGGKKSYPFSVRYREDLSDVRKAVVLQTWRALDRMFYDPGFHGHDWAATLEKWLPLVMAASSREDYGEMMNWMLGEMNASHMGYYSFGSSSAKETDAPRMGLLGVLWDESYVGPGRKVAEVLAGTPAARSISALFAGDVVLAVNATPYAAGDNWARLMSDTAGQEVLLEVQGADGEKRMVTLRPTSSIRAALYRRFEDQARARVEDASNGRLGYIHIESMSTGPLIDFERMLFEAGHGKDALIIDVRENGGGWTTDMIMTMLTTRNHAITIPRGGGEGYPQGRRVFAAWEKPVVVLCNENSYSNAEIFSWAIKTLQRGKLVGKQTYGAVISTGGTSLMDGSFVRLPFRGWYVNDANHTNMELNGCPPDYPVENLPGDFVTGLDRQLEKAIEVGLEQL
jgi:C-terminal processing protease CtpA/Prc/Tol biopolymer transport system component